MVKGSNFSKLQQQEQPQPVLVITRMQHTKTEVNAPIGEEATYNIPPPRYVAQIYIETVYTNEEY